MMSLPSPVSAEALAKILLIQSLASQLPDEKAILDFICRGLEDMPGVLRAGLQGDRFLGQDPAGKAEQYRFPVQLQGEKYAEIILVASPEHFRPYCSYIQNLCFTTAVMFEERRLRLDNERYRRELEDRVAERTRQLTEQVREREWAEKRTVAEKIRAERYLEISEAITLELDRQGRIEIINTWGAEILGYPPQELIGKDWIDLAVPPERREAVREIFCAIMCGNLEDFEYVENEIVARGGARHHIAWHNALRRSGDGQILGTLSFGSDITERKQAERSLRLKQKDLDHAQAMAHIGNWRLNVLRDELVWSDEAYRIFGVEEGTPLTYERFLNLIHPQDRAFVDARWAAALSGKPYDIEHRIIVDGATKWVREKAELEFGPDGQLLGGFGTVQDISDRKQLEADLVSSMRAAQEANRAKSQFLANMSHELRTPLTVIMGYLEVMAREKIEVPHFRQLLRLADDSAQRLLRIISELLDFASIEEGRLQIEERAFDLRKCVQRVVEKFAPSAQSKGVEVALAVSPELPERVIGDPSRFGQILKNLVGNAVKFTERGKIEITVARLQTQMLLAVRDTGIGIPAEHLERIFEPFTQVNGTMTRPYGGTGLGLTLSKELVELLGGTLRVESHPGQGSTFSCLLPLKEFQEPEAAGYPAGSARAPGALRVLLAEDDPSIRNLMQIILTHRGLEVALAGNGLQAIHRWQKEPFDLILMDLQMPEMDGLEATRRIREMENGQKIVIYALTAHARPEDKEKCLRAGMNGILTKPLRMDELDNLLKNCSPLPNS